jgi:hypothetical protein
MNQPDNNDECSCSDDSYDSDDSCDSYDSDDSCDSYIELDYDCILETHLKNVGFPVDLINNLPLYWNFVNNVSELHCWREKESYLRDNYTIEHQFIINDLRCELEIELLVEQGFSDFNGEFDISYSTSKGVRMYVGLLLDIGEFVFMNGFFERMFIDDFHYNDEEYGFIFWYQYDMENAARSLQKMFRKKKQNKAARVIQCKFLDWFYKPICKDGTFGLNCLLAQRLCN